MLPPMPSSLILPSATCVDRSTRPLRHWPERPLKTDSLFSCPSYGFMVGWTAREKTVQTTSMFRKDNTYPGWGFKENTSAQFHDLIKRQLPDGRSAKRVDLLCREGQPLPENTKRLDYRRRYRFRGKRQKGHVIRSPVSSGQRKYSLFKNVIHQAGCRTLNFDDIQCHRGCGHAAKNGPFHLGIWHNTMTLEIACYKCKLIFDESCHSMCFNLKKSRSTISLNFA